MNRARIALPALLIALAAAAPAPAAPARTAAAKIQFVLPFIEDDYARALHEARARKIPIFIEAWAPW